MLNEELEATHMSLKKRERGLLSSLGFVRKELEMVEKWRSCKHSFRSEYEGRDVCIKCGCAHNY